MPNCTRIRFRSLQVFLMTFCIFINCCIGLPAKHVDAAEMWLKPISNDYQRTVNINNDYIRQVGRHNPASDNVVRYRTLGYRLSSKRYDLDMKFKSGSNSSISYSYLSGRVGQSYIDSDGYKVTPYTIDMNDFVKAAADIGITGEYIMQHGGASVYMHNVFETYLNDATLVSPIFGKQEFLAAASWSETTQNVIDSYYNYEFQLTKEAVYDIEIIAVDSAGKELDGAINTNGSATNSPLYTGSFIYGENFSYTLANADKKLKVSEIKYTYDHYYYRYTRRTDGKVIKNSNNPKSTVSFITPDAKPGSTMTVYLVYDNAALPPTPTPAGPTPTPRPEIPDVNVPEPDSAFLDFTDIVNTGVIRADVRGTERFVATLGVPTTESLFGEVKARDYLLGYRFIKKVGIEYYTVKVTKNYILTWKTATPDSEGGGEPVTETVPVTQTITVPRAYGYWEIENLECYKIDNAVLRNYALPNESVTIYPNYTYYNPPAVNYHHSSSKDYHVIPPDEAVIGITLPDETISSTDANPTRKPSVKKEDFTYEAQTQTGKVNVRSDSLVFNGSTVISNQIVETEAPDINISAIPQCNSLINENVLYKNNLIIDATKKNDIYPSSGTITYTSLTKVGSTKPDKPQYNIDGVNTVIIHTPVVCNPSITSDNDKYVQLINPTDGYVQLVLDPDPTLSDFIVNISNIGFHTGKQGYFTRDFSYSLRDSAISYIASMSGLLRNEVKFPFDVYVDVGSDNIQTNDDYVKAGTWVTIGRESPRFYLPAWNAEGTYIVDFRTVAVNGEDSIEQSENFANKSLNNYVATKTMNVEVSGRIYGLTAYDVTDYPIWEEAFRVPETTDFKKNLSSYIDGTDKANYNKLYAYTYSVGTNDQYGNDTGRNIKYTFPLVNGSHPYYKNQGILKTGYMVRFSLDTVGTMFSDACSVTLKPNFYFVDKNGGNRTAVDLYYTEEINGKSKHLVKVGGAVDKTNIKKVMIGDLNLGIPSVELKQTSALRGEKYGNYLAGREAMFTFSNIRLNYAFRTYAGNNYLANVKALDSYEDVVSSGISQDDAMMAIQRWYGQFYIPNETHAVAKGYDIMDHADKYGVDYNEDFWLTNGYIIVNFTIETLNEYGQRRLSYINATNYTDNGNCSMWITEAPALSKASYKGPTFKFYAGDFIIYYANKKMSDDYSSGAIY